MRNHDITIGAPDGRNKSTSLELWIARATRFKPIKETRLKPIVVNAKLVMVNVNGTMPIKLHTRIIKNNRAKYDEYPWVEEITPEVAKRKLDTNVSVWPSNCDARNRTKGRIKMNTITTDQP
jgi:hypothetical protein